MTAGTLGDCSDVKVLSDLVERLCCSLAEDLASDGVCTKQVIVKVKRSDFTVKQQTTTLLSHTACAADLALVAVKMLHKEMPATLRLVGVKVSQLAPASGGGYTSNCGGILQRAMQASDSAAVVMCPVCLKAIVGEPPNVRAHALLRCSSVSAHHSPQVHANKCLLAASASALKLRPVAPLSSLAAADAELVTVITDSSQEEQKESGDERRHADEEDRLPRRNALFEVIEVDDSVSPPCHKSHKRAPPIPSSKIDHFFKKHSNKSAQ